jgi:hypothetical protein
MALCWHKEEEDSWGFTMANYFLFITNTMQYQYPIGTEECKLASTRTSFRFFMFGGALALFLQNYNNLRLGVTLSPTAVLAPVSGTFLAIFKLSKHFHVISHHPDSTFKSAMKCYSSIILIYLLGYGTWLLTVFGQDTTDYAEIEANYTHDHYDCDKSWPVLCDTDWYFWVGVVSTIVALSLICCLCCCCISCC